MIASSPSSTRPGFFYQLRNGIHPLFFAMPADSSPPPYTLTPTSLTKSKSSPLLQTRLSQTSYPLPRRRSTHVMTESEADDGPSEDEAIYALSSSSRNLKPIVPGSSSGGYDRPRMICTARGAQCAGETETEIDEPVRFSSLTLTLFLTHIFLFKPKHLPTTRIVPHSGPLIPLNTLQQRLTPVLFEFSRLLSIVPALFGTLYNIYHIFRPPASRSEGRSPPECVDYAVSAIWVRYASFLLLRLTDPGRHQAILTGYQCLCLTTGLLTRWRLYYSPLSTLIRLLALQGICWPATQLTCTILEHDKRPVIVWAVIGTTTCVSRSLQIWVTSNLWRDTRDHDGANGDGGGGGGGDGDENVNVKTRRRGNWRRWGGRWGGRRWDWKEVAVKCVLPAGLVYFVMAWAEQLRREFSGT